MHNGRRRGGAALALLGMGTVGALAAGCGSSSSNNSTAHIRGANEATNAATADVLVNGAALGGDLAVGQVSPYNFIGQNTSTFSFTTTAVLLTGIAFPASPSLPLNTGSYYTAYLIGRSDVNGKASPHFLQTVVTGDKGAASNYAATPYSAPPSGQANVRILNAASDAGAVDVLINGQAAFSGVAYPSYPTPSTGDTTMGAATTPVTAYQAVPGGTISVQVNKAGTSTILVPATSVSLSGGSAYTLVVTEPAVTPTFGLQLVSDQP